MERVNGVPAGERENMGPTQNGKTGKSSTEKCRLGWDMGQFPGGYTENGWHPSGQPSRHQTLEKPRDAFSKHGFPSSGAIQDAVKMDSRRVKVGS